MRRLAPCLALGALLLAGCTGAPGAPPDPAPQSASLPPAASPAAPGPEAPPASYMTFPWHGHVIAAAGSPAVIYVVPNPTDPRAGGFEVLPGAVAIVAELWWGDARHDLDLELAAPGCDHTLGNPICIFVSGGMPGQGDTPVRFLLQDPALLGLTGDWVAVAWAKSAVDEEFHGATTVFYGEAPPDGWHWGP